MALTAVAGRSSRWDRAPWLLFVAGLALLVVFDLGTSQPFNDEFIYRWVVQRLVTGHGLHLFPGQAPFTLVQVVLGAVLSGGTAEPHVLRLVGVPFVALVGVSLYRLSRDLGADRFFSGIAAAAPMAMPVFAGAATGFMTEPFYLGLVMAASVFACRWIRDGRSIWPTILLTGVAVLERQHAAAIAPALSLCLVWARSRREVLRREWYGLAALWVATVGALVGPVAAGLQTPQMRDSVTALLHPSLVTVIAPVLYLPGMVGLAALAFAGALPWPRPPLGERPWWKRWVVPPVLGLVAVVGLVTFLLPGNYLTPAGLNPVTVAGTKPNLYGPLFSLLGGLCLAGFVLLALRPSPPWRAIAADPRVLFLAVTGAIGLVPLLGGDLFDRYYLPALVPWLPLLALAAGRARWPRAARAWALAVVAIGLVTYTVGEQDYQSWQVARAAAEVRAERLAAPVDIFSGFETYGVDAVLPYYDRTGRLLPTDRHGLGMADPGRRARVVLVITGPSDPRAGVAYSSLAPGKIVIECRPSPCPTGLRH